MPNAEITKPNYYIFIATGIEWEPFSTGQDITATLLSKEYWLASEYTPFRKDYRLGDRALFYVAGAEARHFVGDALIAGPVDEATQEELVCAKHLGLRDFRQHIPLNSVRVWQNPIAIKPLVDDLEFLKNKHYYGLNLRQAAARISVEDYNLILKRAGLTGRKD